MPTKKKRPAITSVEDYRRALALAMSEEEVQQHTLDLLRTEGFLAYHTHNSQRSEPGFPDAIAVHAEQRRLLVIEFKRQMPDNPTPTQLKKLNPTPAQVAWLNAFSWIASAEVHVFRPLDWLDGTIERAVTQRLAA